MKVLACGSRTLVDVAYVFEVLDALHARKRFTKLVHGLACGADTLAAEWAAQRGIPIKGYPADWRLHGLSAGPLRNRAMLAAESPELVVAFPGGKGTSNMVTLARLAHVPVFFVPASTRALHP